MKNKKTLKSLKLEKKTISNLNPNGGILDISTFPNTFKRVCPTSPILCDPVSFPDGCFPIDTI